MSAKTIITLVCLLLIPLFGFAQGEEHGVDILLTSQRLIEVEPGRIVTGSYLVTNRTGHDVELYEYLELPTVPDGWQPMVVYERSILLETDKQKVQLVTFVVPKTCPAGKYEIIYSLIDKRYGNVKTTATFTIVVVPVIKFDAIVEEKPDFVMAGEEYHVQLRLVNNGNSETPMRLEAKGSPDYPVAFDLVETTIEAGKSQMVNLFVSTDEKLIRATNHAVEISTIAQAPDNTFVTVKRSILVEILPKFVSAIDPRNSVPSRVRFIATGEEKDGGMQIEYSGSGKLDDNGDRTIDFLFRGPDIKDQSIYGTRDMLRFNYRGPVLNLLLGDKAYSLSPLTERLLYGRGGEMSFHRGGIELGSFFMETRWDVPGKKEVGAFASYDYEEKLGMKVNYLNKHKDGTASFDGYDADIYSILARISPNSAFNLGMEYSYCMSGDDGGSNDPAHRVTLDGEISDRVWYTFENTYAGPRFLGYYNDVLYSSGTVAASIYRNLRGNFSYRIYKNNLNLDQAKTTAVREQLFRGVLSYPFSFGTNISLDYNTLVRKDDMLQPQFDFGENVWRFGLGHAFDKFNFQVYSELASFKDNIIGDPARTLHRHSIYANFYPSPRQAFSLYTRMGHNSFTGNPEETTSIGLSAVLQPANALRASLSYQADNINADRLPKQYFLISSLDYTLPNKHSISLKYRWFKFERANRSDHTFFAAYTIPFDIPALKKKSIGAMKGRVIDVDKIGAPPMENVLVSLGTIATMTDQMGEFYLQSLQAGTYAIHVDQRSIGMNRITTDPSPFEIEVIGGETIVQEIGISTASMISGRVVLYAVDPDKMRGTWSTDPQSGIYATADGKMWQRPVEKEDLSESGGLEGVIIEISRGDEIYRQVTDQKGRFSFRSLRPGTWQLKVYESGLPHQHYLEETNFTIELKNNENRRITVSVLPRLRSIQMLDAAIVEERGE